MAKSPERAQQRHTRDKSIIDQVARNVPKPKDADRKQPERSPTTSTGLPVEDQIRKEWDSRKVVAYPPFERRSAYDGNRRPASGTIDAV
jgi:hypothetical protein